jgi:hypothetical protein
MQSAPSAIADNSVITFRPGFAAPERCPRSTAWSTTASIPNRAARTAGTITPAFATARSSSKTTTADSCTMRMTSWIRAATAAICRYQARFRRSLHPPARTDRWIEA